MVKNKTGGSKHKKMARKNAEPIVKKMRFKDQSEKCEVYAVVTKNFGQGNCEVTCNDEKVRLCVIRNKFKGRNKRSNKIFIGCYVLVGLRDWETSHNNKKEKCDLLEVYDNNQGRELEKDKTFNKKYFKTILQDDSNEKNDENKYVNHEDDGFEFIRAGDNSQLYSDDNNIISNNTKRKIKFEDEEDQKETLVIKDNGEIDFDLI